MQIVLWIVQGLVGLAFLMAGFMKATQAKEKLAENMAWVEDFDANIVKGIGILEILGGLGVILPVLLNIFPFLTPLAAIGLIVVMIGAAITHIRRQEYPMIGINTVLALLAAVVLWGYWDLLPF